MKIYSPQIIGTLDVTGSAIVTGSLDVSTNITASNLSVTGLATLASASITYLETIYETASVIYSSGSNQFGDASNDVQTLYGTVDLKNGPLRVSGSTILSGSTDIQGGDFKVTDQAHNAEFDVDTFKVQTLNGAQFTGSVISTGGFTGSLQGTASYANNSTSASFANNGFPFTGSAQITGSLGVTGSVSTNGTVNLTGTNKWINSTTTGAYPFGDGLVAVASANPSVNASARYSGVFASTNATIGSSGFMAFVLGGDLNDVDGTRTGVVGGYNNNVSAGSNSYIFGGSLNDITATGTNENIIVGGNNFNTTAASGPTIGLGGTNNTISGGANNAILAGTGSTNNQNNSVIIGGQGITATKANTVFTPGIVAAGSVTQSAGSVLFDHSTGATDWTYKNNNYGVTRFNSNGSLRSVEVGNGILNNSIGTTTTSTGIFVSNGSNVSGEVGVVVGCGSSTFGGVYAAMVGCEETAQNTAINGRGVLVAGLYRGGAVSNRWATDVASSYSALVGGGYQRMEGALYTGILGGSYNYISGSSTFTISGSAIIGGNNNTAKHNNVVILGGNTISSTAANTVYVPNLDVSGSSTFKASTVFSGSVRGEVNALSITSNTASLNCALDNFFTLQLVAGTDTYINPSNINPGQTINVRINTTGSATVSFPSSVLQASGSVYVPTTTTGVDIVTLISFDSTSLYLANVKNLI